MPVERQREALRPSTGRVSRWKVRQSIASAEMTCQMFSTRPSLILTRPDCACREGSNQANRLLKPALVLLPTRCCCPAACLADCQVVCFCCNSAVHEHVSVWFPDLLCLFGAARECRTACDSNVAHTPRLPTRNVTCILCCQGPSDSKLPARPGLRVSDFFTHEFNSGRDWGPSEPICSPCL